MRKRDYGHIIPSQRKAGKLQKYYSVLNRKECMDTSKTIKDTVRESYALIAKSSGGCCCGGCGCDSNQNAQRQSGQMGYSQDEMDQAPQGSNLGLGCGNPTAIASLKEGEVVLDLGSGAGFDAFLASSKVGKTGKVIGVDMTDEMLQKARENAKKGNYQNVEFRKGHIEELPVDSDSINTIISNCVINLAPDKTKVFNEAYRALKVGGRLMVSDVVLIKPLSDEIINNKELLVGCVSGAILRQDYLDLLKKAGFLDITIHKVIPAFLEEYAVSMTYSAYKKL
jgi:arsenite methyltransferase